MADEIPTPRTAHPWVAAGAGALRFGLQVFPQPPDWPAFRALVGLAEALGFDSFWAYDHPLIGADGWTTLAALAPTTARLRLGMLVSCVYYRHPGLLARVAADVDRASGGRLVLGLGIGDWPPEFAQLGLPFPPVGERQAALEEAVQIVLGLWREAPFTFRGRHFRVEAATGAPGPVQQPRVPLLIAGGGERVTLRQVAQYADAANFSGHVLSGHARSLADVRRKWAALRRHCAALGRPYGAVLRSYQDFPFVLAETPAAVAAKVARLPAPLRDGGGLFAGTPEEAVAHYRALAAAGVQYFVATVHGADAETVRLLGERVVPAVTAAGAPPG